MILKLRTDRALDPVTVSVIRAINNLTEGLGLNTLLVGATARVILLEHVHDQVTGRRTHDIDFAVAVENWEQFRAIKDRLISSGEFTQDEKIVHRLSYGPTVTVDLIPFGEIEDEESMLRWPPPEVAILNMAGFRDAYESAVKIEIEPDLIVSVASIPGMSVLKLFAWNDRRHEEKGKKDAQDFLYLLREYHNIGSRIYGDEAEAALMENGYNAELTGAWLLGYDAFSQSMPNTKNSLASIFLDRKLMDALTLHMAADLRMYEDAQKRAKDLLDQYVKGFSQ
ncbi:MAG: nucleotidyl transferase AbiEii/AbiGii toxin family protein [Betaproteobacteria bacterium]|nr:nucleotidyl transferase AbiEii/AbiGii toxin family protein [Betaproteobacteria bacterium]